MNCRINSAKHLMYPILPLQSPTYHHPHQSFSTHFIDSTTESLDDDYQVEVQTIISTLRKLGNHISKLSHNTLQRLENTINVFYNDCIVPFKSQMQLRKQVSTPKLHSFKIDAKFPSNTSNQQLKDRQIQTEMLKLEKLKTDLQQENSRRQSVNQVKQIQMKYVDKQKPLDVHFCLARLIKQIFQKVQKSESINDFVPYIRDIYREVWRLYEGNKRVGCILKQYCDQAEGIMGFQDEQEEIV